MDDLAIIAPSLDLITGFITQIKKQFIIKELGLIKDYLGIDIEFNPNTFLKLSQTKSIEKAWLNSDSMWLIRSILQWTLTLGLNLISNKLV